MIRPRAFLRMINAIDETSPALVPVNSQELEWFPSRVNALASKWFRVEPNHELTQREIFYLARVNASQTPPPIRNSIATQGECV